MPGLLSAYSSAIRWIVVAGTPLIASAHSGVYGARCSAIAAAVVFVGSSQRARSGRPAATIRRIALEYAERRPGICLPARGAFMHHNGVQTYRALSLLQALVGNLDPVREILTGTPEGIHAAFVDCHRAAGSRYIVGAGCEIPRGTPFEAFRTIVEFARNAQGGA